MTSQLKALSLAGVLVVGLAGAGVAYAHGTGDSRGSMMGPGMMGQGGMMNMMSQMSEMMETCNKMMQGKMEGHHPPSPGGKVPEGGPGADKDG